SWNISNVKNIHYVFYRAKAFDQSLSNWHIEDLVSPVFETTFTLIDESNLSQVNYDKTLINWERNGLSNCKIYANGLNYCLSENAIKNLMTRDVIFIGDKKNCSTNPCPSILNFSTVIDDFENSIELKTSSNIIKANNL